MDLSTDLILLLKFDDFGVFLDLAQAWILKCYPASIYIFSTVERSCLLHLRVKRGAKAPEPEEELPRTDSILSLTPTVFTAAADLEGLLQCACVRL